MLGLTSYISQLSRFLVPRSKGSSSTTSEATTSLRILLFIGARWVRVDALEGAMGGDKSYFLGGGTSFGGKG